ncbi:alpha/beta hydrolase domain-containing protein [Acidobacteriota bacterium]
MRFKWFFSAVLVVLILLPAGVNAEVVRLEIENKDLVADGKIFGRSGAYEKITGKIYLEVDPDHPANLSIIDLKLAPRNKNGRVEFATEFELHKPVDLKKGNHRLIYFVNNRGRKVSVLGAFHAGGGEDWLYRQGWTFLWCGWNGDAIPSGDRLNIQLPIATENGQTITGKIYAEICVSRTEKTFSQPFYWGGSVSYPVVSMDNSQASLTVRPFRSEDPVEVPRDEWAFARWEDGQAVPDPGHLYIKGGFKPGWLYDLIYVGRDPRVTGLGFAAIRDVVSFFRYEKADVQDVANPLAEVVEHTFIFGISQSGRVIYHFIYQDFNGDEKGRIVFDGAMPHVSGGGKGQFNYRFAQTTRHGSHHEDNLYASDFFPFNTVEQSDPITGEKGDGLGRARKSGLLPKIFFTNNSTEYWTRSASLMHTDVVGEKDAGIDPNVRMYFTAGLFHGDPRFGPVSRALLVAMDLWVSQGIEPPPSRLPKIADGTLVDLKTYRERFPNIPNVQTPESFFMPFRLDPGPRWQTEGIADNVPPKFGARYGNRVPAVNEDGNELAGIQLPDVAVPIATNVGWRLRGPDRPAPGTLERWAGSAWPFPLSAEDRMNSGDPRLSILERYPTKEDYLAKVTKCLLELKRQKFLLDEDVTYLLEQASRQEFWNK